jgi:hypothetical protein
MVECFVSRAWINRKSKVWDSRSSDPQASKTVGLGSTRFLKTQIGYLFLGECLMGRQHLVQVGLMGVVGCYDAIDFRSYERDTRVICRTSRGLEAGKVLCDVTGRAMGLPSFANDMPRGELLRQSGREDGLILERLDRHRDRAFQACEKLLNERGIAATLVDVEHLFDGESIFFYFLGETTPELEAVTAELAETYERKVRFKKFAETLANGCGPDCGTGESGCSSGGCGSCSLAGGCGSLKAANASTERDDVSPAVTS